MSIFKNIKIITYNILFNNPQWFIQPSGPSWRKASSFYPDYISPIARSTTKLINNENNQP
jgi:hypothetical protein